LALDVRFQETSDLQNTAPFLLQWHEVGVEEGAMDETITRTLVSLAAQDSPSECGCPPFAKKSKSRWRCGLLALAFALSTPASIHAETLTQALVDAYQHSGLLEENRALLRVADEDVAIAVSALRPIINWSSDITREFGETRTNSSTRNIGSTDVNLGITAELLLFDFGNARLQVDAQEELVLATRQNLLSVEQSVLLRAIDAYMSVRRDARLETITRNNVNLLRQELRSTKDKFAQGTVTNTDVAQAEARLAGARSDLAFAQSDLNRSVAEFVAAVGRKPGKLQPPRRLPELNPDVEISKSIALRGHPDLRREQHNVRVAEINIDVAKSAQKPRISAFASAGVGNEIGESDYDRVGEFGIEVTGPIYRGGELSSLVRQAISQRNAQLGVLHETRHEIIQDVADAYADLISARSVVVASKEASRAAELALDGIRQEAELGERTTLDILDAEQELLDANADVITAETDVVISSFAALAAIGQLTAEDLKLPVQLYDPEAYFDLVETAPVPLSEQGKKLDRVLKALNKNTD
jgi:outer membrane protein